MSITASLSDPASASSVDVFPVLAVRDAAHFPHTVTTLHVVRQASIKAVRRALDDERLVLVLVQRDRTVEDPTAQDLYRVGVVSEILQALPMPDASLRISLRGLDRAEVRRLQNRGGMFSAEAEIRPDRPAGGLEAEALMRACHRAFQSVVHLNKNIPPEAIQSLTHLDSPGALANTIAFHLPMSPAQKQTLLEEAHPEERLRELLVLLKREEQVLHLDSQIHEKVEKELGDAQREFYLREQLRIIESELQTREHRLSEGEEYLARIRQAAMPADVEEKALAELKRLERIPMASQEGAVVRAYLDCLVQLPWNRRSEDRIELGHARELLERNHAGLPKVKERILEHLAVRTLNQGLRGPILCFLGPPGVGKTSVGRSIAEAMGREFVRLPLGGLRDEAEIRGHRRTYVGAMPGRLLSSLKNCGTRNPVVVLDEIDKIGLDWHGDPASALLEALDPEQNRAFLDHYVEVPFDLSEVLFIATANGLGALPRALCDRFEILEFTGYTDRERFDIAREHLLPRAMLEHGLTPHQLQLDEGTLWALVQDYTQEAGVRGLERALGALCRKAALRLVEGKTARVRIEVDALPEILGRARFALAREQRRPQIGVAHGLVVSEVGGDALEIEASLMPQIGGQPALSLTGNLGEVMRESAQAALTYVRARSGAWAPERPFRFDVHIHVPQGATPKDGPSAGVTIAVALASGYLQRSVRSDLAMTGEITLQGRVLPVGGIRDKVIAAHRHGFREVALPEENLPDLAEVPEEVLSGLTIRPIRHLSELLDQALLPPDDVLSEPHS